MSGFELTSEQELVVSVKLSSIESADFNLSKFSSFIRASQASSAVYFYAIFLEKTKFKLSQASIRYQGMPLASSLYD